MDDCPVKPKNSALGKVGVGIGDWIQLTLNMVNIYGKVVGHNPSTGEMEIITSSIADTGPMKPTIRGGSGEIIKISEKDVPSRARLWVLERIKNPLVLSPQHESISRALPLSKTSR